MNIYFKKWYILFFSAVSFAQTSSSFLSNTNDRTVNVNNSPTAGAFRVFGDFPANNYIGVADINIPIHTLKSPDKSYQVTMKYHNGMGNKIESMPSILGLGWHLDIGGAITLVESQKRRIGLDGTLIGNNNVAFQNNNWSTKEHLSYLLGSENEQFTSIINLNNLSLGQTVYSVNFNGYSGELYFDHEEKPQFRSKSKDKFLVEVSQVTSRTDTVFLPLLASNAIEKRYYLPLEGEINKITLIDSNGIRYEFGGDFSAIEYSRVGHIAYKEKPHKVFDIPQPMTWNLTKIIYPNQNTIELKYKKKGWLYTSKTSSSLVIDSWNTGSSEYTTLFGASKVHINSEQATLVDLVYLNEVITATEKLKFSYKNYPQLKFSSPNYNTLKNSKNSGGSIAGLVDDQIKLKNIFFFKYEDIGMVDFSILSNPIELLDHIEVYDDKGEKRKKVVFDYFTSLSTRPMLINMEITDLKEQTINQGSSENYQFKYKTPNASFLPPYQSYQKDDYGFFSAKNGYLGFIYDFYTPTYSRTSLSLPFFESLTNRNEYIENRKPEDSQHLYLQLLEEITYPTGGTTQFEYEINKYGGIAKNYPFVVETNLNHVAQPAGGVRIKSIKSFDTNGGLEKSTSYKYVRDYDKGSDISSGVLTHVPTYFEFIKGNYPFSGRIYTIDYFNWSTDDIYPAHRLRGNHITYSEVTEINDKDGSFVTYKYKNFDNGYHDKPILNYAIHHEFNFKDEFDSDKEFWKKKDLVSMELERGQLLSKTYFKSNQNSDGKKGEKVKEVLFEYDTNPNRFNQHIRTISLYDNHLLSPRRPGDIYSYSYIASQIYAYTPYLMKEIEIDYQGTSSIVKKETSYQYNDVYKMITEKEDKIGDKTYKTVYKYSFDLLNQTVYKDMEKKYIIAPIILEEHYVNNERVFSQKNNYARWYNAFGWNDQVISPSDPNLTPQNNASNSPAFELANWPLSRSIEKQDKQGAWEKEVDFISYDSKYNLLSSKDKTGKETSYVWGYNRSLPVWVIDNVAYGTLKNLLGSTINKIGTALYPLDADLQTVNSLLQQSPDLKDAVINHYLYDPIRGLIYKENERGSKEYYEYEGFGRLKKVQDSRKNTLIEYEYNYKH